jgi:hypothetical protein
LRPEKRMISGKVFYGTFMILLVSVFTMTGWTYSIANTVNLRGNARTETFQDMYVPYASGVVQAHTFAFLYEAAPSSVWFNVSIDFLSETPINVTLEGVAVYEASSAGELFFNHTIIGQSPITTEIVNASHVRIHGRVVITPVPMAGNVTLGLAIDYWVHTDNQTLLGGWGDLFMLPVTIVPSILRPEGWFYANAITLIIGVILLIRYSILRIR